VKGHSAPLGKTRIGKFKISKNNSHRKTPIVAILYTLITPPEKAELQAGHCPNWIVLITILNMAWRNCARMVHSHSRVPNHNSVQQETNVEFFKTLDINRGFQRVLWKCS